MVRGIHRAVATICGAAASAPRPTPTTSVPSSRRRVARSLSIAIQSAALPIAIAHVKMSAPRKSSAKSAATGRSRCHGAAAGRATAQRIHGSSAIPGWMCGKNASETTTPENTYVTAPIHAAGRERPIERRSARTPSPAAAQWSTGWIRAASGNGSGDSSARTG